jgi:hydroxymethylbilane synthase
MADLVIGTRRSRLARIQSALVRDSLLRAFPGITVEERIILTKGDKILDAPLAKIGDKGLFTREIEQQLIDGGIDLAVHSCKDLPTLLPGGLAIGAVLERVPPEDALIGPRGATLDSLPSGTRVGTGSLRRVAQLIHARPDVKPLGIRGNVNTRIDKLDAGEYDALILARAGLIRMELEIRMASVLDPARWYYAVGQGAIAVEIRKGDERTAGFVQALEHEQTRQAAAAERAFMRELEGGCQVPVGVRCKVDKGQLTLAGMVAGLEGDPFFEGEETGPAEEAERIGKTLARRLVGMGAGKVLEEIRKSNPKTEDGE